MRLPSFFLDPPPCFLRRSIQALLAAYSVSLPFRGTAGLQSALLLLAFVLLLLDRRQALGSLWEDARWVLAPLLLFSLWVVAVCGFWREPPLRSWDPSGWDVHQPWFSLDQWRRDLAQPMLALFCGWWAFRGGKSRLVLFLFQAGLILVLAAKGAHQYVFGEIVDGLHQRGTLLVRGFSRDNIFFSYVLVLLSPAALWLVARWRGRRLSWVPILVLLAMVFLNKRRGTWAAIYVEFFVLAAWASRKRFASFLLISLAVVGLVAVVRPQWFVRDYDFRRTQTVEGRGLILQRYPSLLVEAPLHGVGFGKDTVVKHYWHRIYQHAHNTFVNVALEVGWPGLALWLAALGAYGRRFLRGGARDPAAQIGLAFLVAFCVRNLTDDVWVSSNAELFWFQIGVLMPGRASSES